MAELGFYIDSTKCTGCRACQVACKDKNDLPVGTFFRMARSYEVGEFPEVKGYNISLSCNHCENPACVAACPTGAMYKTEEGPVLHDDDMCIGCQACVAACPYGQPHLIAELGIVKKCDSCIAIRQAGGNPVCVDACQIRALDFGDIDELKAKYGLEESGAAAILPASITGPNLLIRAKECMAEDGAVEVVF